MDLESFCLAVKNKLAESEYDFGADTGSLFPNITSQQKWHAAKTEDAIHLTDGHQIYSFKLQGNMTPHADFLMTKTPDIGKDKMDIMSKVRAQVHRADPGSIYFTLQEGNKNPTYTFKHVSGTSWKGIPKVKKADDEFEKEAFSPAQALNGAWVGAMAPGLNPWTNTALAGGAGLAYHLGKKYLYNTPEENRDEDNLKTMLRRTLYPAAAVGLYSHAANSMFDEPLNQWRATGVAPNLYKRAKEQIQKSIGSNGSRQ